ncbi:hypothetical protein [Streptomyces sp. NPDC058812]|uniref:hypothetical protein n=1 Tax=unclassified Streptomyces TaxID=2593676 RepID=UPI0036A9EDCF
MINAPAPGHLPATRGPHREAVRGFGDPGATGERNLAREPAEEISAHPAAVVPLCELHPDTGRCAHRARPAGLFTPAEGNGGTD